MNENIKKYCDLVKIPLNEYLTKNAEIKLSNPTSIQKINEIESIIWLSLPQDIKNIYLISNGVSLHYSDPIWDIDTLIWLQNTMRETNAFKELYSDFSNILFFWDDWGWNYFWYKLNANWTLPWDVFIWNHENDSRTWVANTATDLIMRIQSEILDY